MNSVDALLPKFEAFNSMSCRTTPYFVYESSIEALVVYLMVLFGRKKQVYMYLS